MKRKLFLNAHWTQDAYIKSKNILISVTNVLWQEIFRIIFSFSHAGTVTSVVASALRRSRLRRAFGTGSGPGEQQEEQSAGTVAT